MEKTILTVDSGVGTLDNNVEVIPVQVLCSDNTNYLDGVNIDNKKIIDDLNNGLNYKTSAPPAQYFENVFEKNLKQGNNVVHLTMSSGISEGSYNLSNMIASELNDKYKEKVTVIDSYTGATGGILLSKYAKKLIDDGLSTKEVIHKLELLKRNLQTVFFVPDPSGFLRSGRNKTELSNSQRSKLLIASTAVKTGFKFRVDFDKNGNLVQNGITRGSSEKCFKQLLASLLDDEKIKQYDNSYIAIGNLLEDRINMENIKDYISSLNYFKEILEKDFPSAVAAYGCKDLCGISLMKKR